MGTRDTYQKTLVRACLVAGDETALAKELQVPVSVLVDWVLGDRPVPPDIFLRAVDVVLAATKQQVADNHDFLAQIKRRHR